MKVGDIVVFSDSWFSRRRDPVPPIEERTHFTIRIIADGQAVLDFLEDGRVHHQIVHTDWLKLINESNEEKNGGDATNQAR